MSLKKNYIYEGSALRILKTFPDNSIDMCITSPPYYNLRNYNTEPEIWDGEETCDHEWENKSFKGNKPHHGESSQDIKIQKKLNESQEYGWNSKFCNKCGAWFGELGLEPTPDLYIKHLVDIFREVKRVLKSTGTLWVNIGDSYAGGGGSGRPDSDYAEKHTQFGKVINKGSGSLPISDYKDLGIKAKDLIGIPWLLAFALRNDGWYLRQEIIWAKATSGDIRMGSVMPESTKDRFSKSHESIFLLSKNPHYYFDQESIKEPIKESSKIRYQTGWNGNEKRDWPKGGHNNFSKYLGSDKAKNIEKANRRDTWLVKTKPFKDAHFAIFPPHLIGIPIIAGCPSTVCKECGSPFFCDCNTDETEKGIVLDPFMGSGTTAIMAIKYNRNYVGIEKSDTYITMARKRIKNESIGSLDFI